MGAELMTAYGSGACPFCGVQVPLTKAGALSFHANWMNPDQTCAGSLTYGVRLIDAPPGL